MAGSIICGVDDSESAKAAARVARAFAGDLGAELVFVRVVDPHTPKARLNAIAERLERLRARANGVDRGAAWIVEVGHPADRLVATAAREEASMIVVGSTGPRSSLLGSISADVSRRAPCPVVVVPPGADLRVDGHQSVQDRDGDGDAAAGIVRVGGGGGAGVDSAGGIARFGLGARSREA